MWRLEQSREVRNYLLDNVGIVDDLEQAIKDIAATPDAVTRNGATQLSPNVLMVEACPHVIVYRRIYLADAKVMRVLTVKPTGM